MDWINVHTSFLDSPEFLGSEPLDRATWICVLRYCVGQENGGRIAGCAIWGDRKWQQLVRVTLEEVRRESDLWTWDGDDLIVTAYPLDKQEEVQAKRQGGYLAGSVRGGSKARAARENGSRGGRPTKTQAEPKDETQAEPKLNPTEGKGMEGEGEGRGERGREAPPPPHVNHSEDPKTKNREALTKAMRKAGLPTPPGAIEEWRDLMTGRGACRTPAEVIEGVAWIAQQARKEGATVTFAKHAGTYADKWARILQDRRQSESGEAGAA